MFRSQFLWVFACLFLILVSCSTDEPLSQEAVKGEIDLSEQVINKEQTLILNGEWSFVWNKWLLPSQIEQSQAKRYVNVPASWTTYIDEGTKEKYPAKGAATYQLKVKLPKNLRENIGLEVPRIWSANKVFVNEKEIYRAGKLTTNEKEADNAFLGEIIMLEKDISELDIVVQVANPNFFIAGMIESFKVGNYTHLIKERELKQTWSGIWLGLLFFISFYHIVLFVFRTRNKSTLYFGGITFLLGINHLVFANHYFYEYLYLYTFFDNVVQTRLYFGSLFLLFPLGIYYLASLYPQETKKWFAPAMLIISLMSLLCLFLPQYVHLRLVNFLQPIQLITFLIFAVIILGRAIFRKRDETLWQTIGIVLMILAGLNDALYTLDIKLTPFPELLQFGIGAFILLQIGVLARRFSKAFNRVEDLTINLEQKVVERTKEVNERNAELEQQRNYIEEKNTQITDSIRYAARIQQSILGESENLNSLIANSFIFFRPRDIVSGDFYWFAQVEVEQTVRHVIVCADCTGHGVPGAFMTVMGNDLLNQIVINHKITDPAQILYELDKHVKAAFREQSTKDGMDVSIINYCTQTHQLLFAGAKSPLYVIENNDIREIKGSIHPIGGGNSIRKKKEKIFTTTIYQIEPNTSIYLSSDGYQDQFGGTQDRKYMKKRFRALLLKISQEPIKQQSLLLEQEIDQWQGNNRQTDDMLIIGMKF